MYKFFLRNHTIVKPVKKEMYTLLNKIALVLVIIGALNWGLIGIFSFDLVAWLFGGQTAIISRIVYTLVGLAGIWCISLLFKDSDAVAAKE